METKQREFGLDLVRMTAGVLTLSVHFFLNDEFYLAPVAGESMLVSCIVRMACMTCVPLFLLLTGYLCIDRRWERGYCRKLLPILFTYILSGAACMAFRVLRLGEQYSLRNMIRMFTTYNAAPYGWYIGMYIGLFLLSPFLNAAWHSLERGGKQALLLTLVFLTALPGLVNQLGNILPVWWVEFYPLTYYIAGAWLRENPIRMKRWKLFLCWLGLVVAVGIKGYLTAQGGNYVWMPEDHWNNIVLMGMAVLLFSCLRQFRGDYSPPHTYMRGIRWIVERGSKLALGMYLISYIPDRMIYPVLIQAVPYAQQRVWFMPLVTPVVVFCSAVLAQLVDWASEALMRLVPIRLRDEAGVR